MGLTPQSSQLCPGLKPTPLLPLPICLSILICKTGNIDASLTELLRALNQLKLGKCFE